MAVDVLEGDTDMESELLRTVTIVFWYKENTEPIRLEHMIPTFPFFQLAKFSSLVSDLGLTPTTYLDTYNPKTGKWDQHTISTVRVVETNQRLLYRIRKSIFEAIAESECVSLSEEVDSQGKPAPWSIATANAIAALSRKRSAPAHDEMPTAKQLVRENTHYPTQSPTQAAGPASTPAPATAASPPAIPESGPQPSSSDISVPPGPPPDFDVSSKPPPTPTDLSLSPGVLSSGLGISTTRLVPRTNPYMYQPSIFFATTPSLTTISLPHYLVYPPASPSFIPYHTHPPMKRWPNDYTVSQLAEGFYYLEALSTHQHVTTTLPSGEPTSATSPNMTQRSAFERIFGTRYVKSTICRHRGLWRRAPRELREEFEAYGDDEKGIWGEFVRRVEGKPPGKTVMLQQEIAAYTEVQARAQAQAHAQAQVQAGQLVPHPLGHLPPLGPPPGGPTMIGMPPGVHAPITALGDPHGHGHAHPGHGHPGHEALVFHAMAGAAPGMMVPAGAILHGPPPPASQHQQQQQRVSVSEDGQQEVDGNGGSGGPGGSGVGGGEGGAGHSFGAGGDGGGPGPGPGGGGDEGQSSVQSDSSSPSHHPHAHPHRQGMQPVYDPGLTSASVAL